VAVPREPGRRLAGGPTMRFSDLGAIRVPGDGRPLYGLPTSPFLVVGTAVGFHPYPAAKPHQRASSGSSGTAGDIFENIINNPIYSMTFGGGILHLPQGPSLGSGLFCPGPSSLSRPHPPHSPAHRDFTAWRLIRDAFAVPERLGDPRVVPGFHCSSLPGMPPSPTPGSPTSL
jgi:hypothetical protein